MFVQEARSCQRGSSWTEVLAKVIGASLQVSLAPVSGGEDATTLLAQHWTCRGQAPIYKEMKRASAARVGPPLVRDSIEEQAQLRNVKRKDLRS
jgi:hypothetical protein